MYYPAVWLRSRTGHRDGGKPWCSRVRIPGTVADIRRLMRPERGLADDPATSRDRGCSAGPASVPTPDASRGVDRRKRKPRLLVRDRAWPEGAVERAARGNLRR